MIKITGNNKLYASAKHQIILPYKAFGIVWRNTRTYFIVGFAIGKSVFGLVFWKNIND